MYSCVLKVVSSQLKLLPSMTEEQISAYEISGGTAMKNEPFSFQVLYRSKLNIRCEQVSITAATELPAKAWRVDYVPVLNAANDYNERGYISNDPGIMPDPLMPRPVCPEIIEKGGENNVGALRCEAGAKYLLNSTDRLYQSVWITINPDSEVITAGCYKLKITLISINTLEAIDELEFTFEAIDALLPAHEVYYTNWFHVDCLCDYHNVEPYTDEFYEIFKSYMKNCVCHRMNTLLLPAFTPALDTPRGFVRRNVQLVDITKSESGWSFGFDRLEKFMRIADECGIRVFEHCHLFSQWGAEYAPSIYDTDGNILFNWETDAGSDEYRMFIRSYLKAFLSFAQAAGYSKERLIFHISDEPVKKQFESYKKAYETVAELLCDYNIIDALHETEFWHKGLVKSPVAFIADAEKFYAECDNFWLYYTCGTYARNCTNRLISNTAARTRVLGLQMYRYNAKGFLQWGYNYYYDRMSEGWYDPAVNPCGYKLIPGCAYLAYPVNGGAVPSIREKLMCEAFDDIRALLLLERFIGRDSVMSVCQDILGETIDNHTIPEGNAMYSLREAINAKIKQYVHM